MGHGSELAELESSGNCRYWPNQLATTFKNRGRHWKPSLTQRLLHLGAQATPQHLNRGAMYKQRRECEVIQKVVEQMVKSSAHASAQRRDESDASFDWASMGGQVEGKVRG